MRVRVCVGGSLNLKLFSGEPEIVSIFSWTTVLRLRNPLHIYTLHIYTFILFDSPSSSSSKTDKLVKGCGDVRRWSN